MFKCRFIIYIAVILFSTAALAENERSFAIQTYLNQGKPDQAIETAHMLLDDSRLSENERKHLLELILQAELMITKAKHYEDVDPAIEAIETLIKEFPNQIDEPKLIWQMVELFWNQNNLEQAQSNILDLQNRFPRSPEAQKSWLILGKIYFIHKNYSEARNVFLRYALGVPSESKQGFEVRLWTALVDYEEERLTPAYQEMTKVFNIHPDIITSQDSIYSRYINILDIQGHKQEALKQANQFLAQYKQSSHSAEIRLLRADLIQGLPNPNLEKAIKAYTLLATNEADTIIGRQAFMRKMMIQMRNKKKYSELKPAIIALKRIANHNQMSVVEDEALLHEARLWRKLASTDPEHTPKSAISVTLKHFTFVSKSIDSRLAQQAEAEGKATYTQHLKELIQQEDWEKVVSLWEDFPQFHPPKKQSAPLRFEVAKGLRLLMNYNQAEHILHDLLESSKDSVWGEKVMLEQAKLWRDSEDPQGVQKIMQWLDNHEYTLYRPEMLVIAAQIQLQEGNASLASHSLELIQPEQLAEETQAEFWKIKALTAEALKRWHIAAHAWRMYAMHDVEDVDEAKLNEANDLFKGNDYIKAEVLYRNLPERLQTPAWSYRYSICQLKSGKWNQALERLNSLKQNPDGGIYTSMAALTLAEREADRLLEMTP